MDRLGGDLLPDNLIDQFGNAAFASPAAPAGLAEIRNLLDRRQTAFL
jgi:hypothetical protein